MEQLEYRTLLYHFCSRAQARVQNFLGPFKSGNCKNCHPVCRIFSGPNAAAACAGCCLMKDGKCRGYAVDLILNDVYQEWISSKQMISKFRNTWVLLAKQSNSSSHSFWNQLTEICFWGWFCEPSSVVTWYPRVHQHSLAMESPHLQREIHIFNPGRFSIAALFTGSLIDLREGHKSPSRFWVADFKHCQATSWVKKVPWNRVQNNSGILRTSPKQYLQYPLRFDKYHTPLEQTKKT